MRALPLAALGLVAYGVFLAATYPARLAMAQLESRERNALRVHEAHGTVWHGAARMDVAIGPAWLPVESVAWRVLPAELLSGRLAFAVDAQAAGAAAHGIVARTISAWHARGNVDGPASAAVSVVPLLGTWRPEGRIEMASDGFAWNGREARGDAVVEWRDAATALAAVRPVGSYRAKLHGEGGSIALDVATLSGPLRITGRGSVVPPGRMTFNGEARGEGPDARALDPLLDLMGPRRADGARTLAWRME
jgi:general secretion pathway protein N